MAAGLPVVGWQAGQPAIPGRSRPRRRARAGRGRRGTRQCDRVAGPRLRASRAAGTRRPHPRSGASDVGRDGGALLHDHPRGIGRTPKPHLAARHGVSASRGQRMTRRASRPAIADRSVDGCPERQPLTRTRSREGSLSAEAEARGGPGHGSRCARRPSRPWYSGQRMRPGCRDRRSRAPRGTPTVPPRGGRGRPASHPRRDVRPARPPRRGSRDCARGSRQDPRPRADAARGTSARRRPQT